MTAASVTSTVSIVMPSYKNAHLIGRAIASVQAQTFTDWELIIVDNHSDDGTQALVEGLEDPRIRFELIHNQGIIARSRNRGIELAQGAWIALLDSDDWWVPAKLQTALDAASMSRADITYHNLFLVTRPKQTRGFRWVRGRSLDLPAYDALLSGGNVLANSSVMIKRSTLQAIGPLSEDPDFLAWEDFDLWLRAARDGAVFCHIAEVLGYYWAAGGNTSNPKRTLLTLEAMITHYYLPEGREVPFWVVLAQAMAHLRIGQFDTALSRLNEAMLRQPKGRHALKCRAAQIYCKVRQVF